MTSAQPPRGEVPKRVRVTSPRTKARRAYPTRPVVREIAEQTQLGEVYVESLMRAQFRLSLVVLGGIALAVGFLPAVVVLVPAAQDVGVGPIPLPWLVIGAMLYPFMWLVARSYVRAGERVEGDFDEVVGPR